jgi:hypothetical protein
MFTKFLGFFGIPSPAVLIGLLVAVAAVGAWSYNVGDTQGFNRAEAARAKAQDGAVAALSTELKAAQERAVSEAAARGAATAAADKAKANLNVALKGLRDVQSKPAPTCIPADWRVRVNAAVDAANLPLGTGGSGSLSINLPAPPGSGVGLKSVGGGSALGGGGVHSPARDVSDATR